MSKNWTVAVSGECSDCGSFRGVLRQTSCRILALSGGLQWNRALWISHLSCVANKIQRDITYSVFLLYMSLTWNRKNPVRAKISVASLRADDN